MGQRAAKNFCLHGFEVCGCDVRQEELTLLHDRRVAQSFTTASSGMTFQFCCY